MGEIETASAALEADNAAKARTVPPVVLQDAAGQESTECEVTGNGA